MPEASTDDANGSRVRAETRTPRPKTGWVWWVLSAVPVVVALAFLASRTQVTIYENPTESMQPTFVPGDKFRVHEDAYGLRVPYSRTWINHGRSPQPGDVVMFVGPENGETLVKRVIGIPGDKVSVRDGVVTLNGAPVPIVDGFETLAGKPHGVLLENGGGPDWGPETIPAGKYFVLGDNRGDSRDSRLFGLIDGDAILGRVSKLLHADGSADEIGL